MVITYVTYAILAALLLWGAKFAGFGKKFNDDFLEKNSTKALCGFAAILIILHHISQVSIFQEKTGELFLFNDMGFLLVTIFFFCSGYGLVTSSNNNPNYLKTFPSKRLLTVIVPFIINNIIFGIYYLVKGDIPMIQFVLGIFGLVEVNPNGWYPIVLVILYLVFYFASKKISNKNVRLVIYLITSLAMISLFCVIGHFAWWAGKPGWWLTSVGQTKAEWWMKEKVFWFSGEWWVNSSIGFVVGAAFGEYKEKIVSFFKKGYWIKLIVLIGLFVSSLFYFYSVRDKFGYWSEYGGVTPQIKDKFITSAAQLPVALVFVVAVFVLTMKFRSENPVTRFMGKISYETYLYGVIAIESFQSLLYVKMGFKNYIPVVKKPFGWNLALYEVLVIAASILMGFIFNKLDNYICRKIRREK